MDVLKTSSHTLSDAAPNAEAAVYLPVLQHELSLNRTLPYCTSFFLSDSFCSKRSFRVSDGTAVG